MIHDASLTQLAVCGVAKFKAVAERRPAVGRAALVPGDVGADANVLAARMPQMASTVEEGLPMHAVRGATAQCRCHIAPLSAFPQCECVCEAGEQEYRQGQDSTPHAASVNDFSPRTP